MLPLVGCTGNAVALADWLEIWAVCSGDSNASAGDLVSAIQSELGPEGKDAAIAETAVADSFSLVNERALRGQESYPFDVPSPGVLEVKGEWREYPAYMFCLCLSLLGSEQYTESGKLFESVAVSALHHYVCGPSVRFGSPRDALPTGFAEAVDDLCSRMGEGAGYSGRALPANPKDDKLDIVAWRDPGDGRCGKIVVFGQCASGNNWQSKRSELDPRAFCKNWMKQEPPSAILRAFCVPFDVPANAWEYEVNHNSLFFDRLRLCIWCKDFRYANLVEWTAKRLADMLDA